MSQRSKYIIETLLNTVKWNMIIKDTVNMRNRVMRIGFALEVVWVSIHSPEVSPNNLLEKK